MEFAWKKEDVKELHANIRSANETLADALRACQLYLAGASFGELCGIRTLDLPALARTLQDMRIEGLLEVTRSIASWNTVESERILRELDTEAQNTRETIIESGWTTTAEVGQMLSSNAADLHAMLLPPIKQHMEELQQGHLREFRAFRGQFQLSDIISSARTGSSSRKTTSERSCSSTDFSSLSDQHMKTKQAAAVQWRGRIPLGIGSIILRREVRQRILIRVRRYLNESDTSIDTETSYILGFVPSSWIFCNSITGCNWKFTFKTTRRLDSNHPAWKAAEGNNIDAIIKYFQNGTLCINDVNNNNGQSMLHYGLQSYSYEFCQWLINNGADAHLTDDTLQTAVFQLMVVPGRNDGQRRHRRELATESGHDDYDPLMDLLVAKCQLDPIDTDISGRNAFEPFDQPQLPGFGDQDDYLYARLLKHSLALSTEPEGHPIQELFHNRATDFQLMENNSCVARLRRLIIKYQETGLDDDHDAEGRKWWHTVDFLWQPCLLMPRQIEDPWLQEQLNDVVRAGVDVHSPHKNRDENNKTILQHLAREQVRGSGNVVHLIRWLSILHKARNVTMADYLKEELRIYPGGEFREVDRPLTFHFYQEYPVFTVKYGQSSNDVEFTLGLVVADHATTVGSLPGAFETDLELNKYDGWGNPLQWRPLCGQEPWQMTAGIPTEVIAELKDPADAPENTSVSDWCLTDGRKGRIYPLYTVSTASFDSGDYSEEAAFRYRRDFEHNPVWIEYPEGWVILRTRMNRAALQEYGMEYEFRL